MCAVPACAYPRAHLVCMSTRVPARLQVRTHGSVHVCAAGSRQGPANSAPIGGLVVSPSVPAPAQVVLPSSPSPGAPLSLHRPAWGPRTRVGSAQQSPEWQLRSRRCRPWGWPRRRASPSPWGPRAGSRCRAIPAGPTGRDQVQGRPRGAQGPGAGAGPSPRGSGARSRCRAVPAGRRGREQMQGCPCGAHRPGAGAGPPPRGTGAGSSCRAPAWERGTWRLAHRAARLRDSLQRLGLEVRGRSSWSAPFPSQGLCGPWMWFAQCVSP